MRRSVLSFLSAVVVLLGSAGVAAAVTDVPASKGNGSMTGRSGCC